MGIVKRMEKKEAMTKVAVDGMGGDEEGWDEMKKQAVTIVAVNGNGDG